MSKKDKCYVDLNASDVDTSITFVATEDFLLNIVHEMARKEVIRPEIASRIRNIIEHHQGGE